MSPLLYLYGAFAVAFAGLLVAESRGSRPALFLFKPLCSLGFVASALLAGALSSRYGLAILVGLGLSLCGDVLLIPRTPATFRAGLVAFLLGHLAYVVAFLTLGVTPGYVGAAALPVLAAALGVMLWLRPKLGPMFVPVLAYVVVISTMVVLAVGTWPLPDAARRVTGALAFYLSDLCVARDRFVSPGFVNRAFGLPLYYGGQLLLASSCAAWAA